MSSKRLLVSAALALLVLTTVPASVSAAGDGADVGTEDCDMHIPEDPDCDGKAEQPGGDDYDGDRDGGNSGLIGAIVGIVAALF